MVDRFAGMSSTLGPPYVGGAAITKSDTTIIDVTRAVWVGGTGDLAVRYADGTSDTLQSVPAGTLLPIRIDKVMAATTATKISALY